MIFYDSANWTSILKVRGSVFPKATLYALPAATVAALVKYLENQMLWSFAFTDSGSGSSNTVYSGFTFVLGFVLVFRASQSYARYWLAATSVRLMQAEWMTACSTLIAFSKVSKKGMEDVMAFVHTAIRLFALLHAMALEEIADFNDFPLLDIQAFREDELTVLSAPSTQGRRVELVFHWIQAHIVGNVDSGLLNCPSPLLTRVFQNLGNGLVNYYGAQQVVIWPFPFAYAQMNSVFVFIYSIVTPLVISGWTSAIWSCASLSFVSVMSMMSLDLIAIELENPFGDDANDLPVHQMQQNFNEDLTMLVDQRVWHVPKLLPRARISTDVAHRDQMSLADYAGGGVASRGSTEDPTASQTGLQKMRGWKLGASGGGSKAASFRSFARTASMELARSSDCPTDSVILCVEQKDGALPFRRSSNGFVPTTPSTPAETPKHDPAGAIVSTKDELGEDFSPRSPADGERRAAELADLLKDQQELLEQHRDVSEQHLRQDSAFQERVLSLLEQLRANEPKPVDRDMRSPRPLDRDMRSPRAASPRSVWELRSPRLQEEARAALGMNALRIPERTNSAGQPRSRPGQKSGASARSIPPTAQTRGGLPACGPCAVG